MADAAGAVSPPRALPIAAAADAPQEPEAGAAEPATRPPAAPSATDPPGTAPAAGDAAAAALANAVPATPGAEPAATPPAAEVPGAAEPGAAAAGDVSIADEKGESLPRRPPKRRRAASAESVEGRLAIAVPKWVTHAGTGAKAQRAVPIYAIDVHPSGTRFATAGKGACAAARVNTLPPRERSWPAADGLIKIWNMLPVMDARAEADPSVPRLLCVLNNHSSAVNCLKWSGCVARARALVCHLRLLARLTRGRDCSDGVYLASGSDDRCVAQPANGRRRADGSPTPPACVAPPAAGPSFFGSSAAAPPRCWAPTRSTTRTGPVTASCRATRWVRACAHSRRVLAAAAAPAHGPTTAPDGRRRDRPRVVAPGGGAVTRRLREHRQQRHHLGHAPHGWASAPAGPLVLAFPVRPRADCAQSAFVSSSTAAGCAASCGTLWAASSPLWYCVPAVAASVPGHRRTVRRATTAT